ncbi:hypothetical protein ACJJTC_008906 [Scirpophaga incertulas]
MRVLELEPRAIGLMWAPPACKFHGGRKPVLVDFTSQINQNIIGVPFSEEIERLCLEVGFQLSWAENIQGMHIEINEAEDDLNILPMSQATILMIVTMFQEEKRLSIHDSSMCILRSITRPLVILLNAVEEIHVAIEDLMV